MKMTTHRLTAFLQRLFRFQPAILAVLLGLGLITQASNFGAQLALAASFSYTNSTTGTTTGSNDCSSTLSRTFNVSDSFTITDLDVEVDLTHAERGDFRLQLTSPLGTMVEIISSSTDTNDNYDVLLDSASGNALNDGNADASGDAGYDRTAAPSNSLNAFNGQSATGTWTLQICDSDRNMINGTFNYVTLSFQGTVPSTVSGNVFQDYNGDGTLTSATFPTNTATDRGISGVAVRIFSSTGTASCTTTTNSSGAYTFNVNTCNGGGALTGPYRVEFTGLPSGYSPGPRSTDSVESGSATTSGTAVQFVSGSGATNVNLAINHPADYCQNHPDMVCPAYINGNPLGGGTAGTGTAAYRFPYSGNDVNQNESGATETPVGMVTSSQIGATWGAAYSRNRNLVFLSAVQKRHVGYGPLGTGGIYYFAPNSGASVTNWLNVGGISGINTGANPHSGLPNSSGDASYDGGTASFEAVGRLSLGDLEISDDETTLWSVNLNGPNLLEIPIGSGTTPTTPTTSGTGANDIKVHSFPSGLCTNGVFRPWALKFYRGLIYVGGVCDGTSGNQTNLQAYILSHNPTGTLGSFTTVYNFPLNYNKSCGFQESSGSPEYDCDGWEIWQSSWTNPESPVVRNETNVFYSKPQPMLTDIEFDVDGSMVLGLADRWGFQTGYQNRHTSTSDSGFYNGVASGDILRICNISGTFQREGTGSCPAPKNNLNGGTEFYDDDTVYNGAIYHPDATFGALALLPGSGEVATTALDATDTWDQGVVWLDNSDGTLQPNGGTTDDRNYRVLDNLQNVALGGKATGLGDLEILCAAAPIEIGNRVWRDSDGDGVQDAGEMPLAGLTVQLLRNGGVIGTAVTDANGEYYFTSTPGSNDSNTADNIGQVNDSSNGIQRNTAYVIRIDPTVSGNVSGLNGLALSSSNATDTGAADAGVNADARDSDATTVSSNFEIALTTGGAGSNTHTLDFGFAPMGSIGNRVWYDEDSNGYQDEGEDGIPKVRVWLDTNNNGAIDTGEPTTYTDAQGYYLFKGLAAGTYRVRVDTTTLNSELSQTTIYPNPGADLNNQQITSGNGYQITLAVGQSNLTADFGYNWNPTSSVNGGGTSQTPSTTYGTIGDRVWIDGNNGSNTNTANGRQDPSEVGVSGATVTLYGGPGTDNQWGTGDDVPYTAGGYVSTRTTDQNGYYIFDSLPPGQYVVKVTSDSGASHTILTSGYTQTGDPEHYGTTGTNNDNQTTIPIVLGPGDVFLDADFGYTPNTGGGAPQLGSIGNFVWLDTDADGVGPTVGGEAHGGGVTPGTDSEEGIAGVSVSLIRDLNDNNVWDANEPIIATMFTSDGTQDVDGDGNIDPKGYYRFRNLQTSDTNAGEDDYIVWVNDTGNVLDGLRATYDADGGTTPGSGVVTGYGISAVAPLSTTAVVNQDFGYAPDNSGKQSSRTTFSLTANTGMIGNFVWFDLDGDGVGPHSNGLAGNDNNEVGIPNVRVNLYDSTGTTLIATTLTGPTGYYLFPNLTAGGTSYVVKVDTTTLPGGTLAWDQTYDQNGVATANQSTEASLDNNEVSLGHDFGYIGQDDGGGINRGSIGNLVWNDANADGDVDAGESGINGVTVDLYYDADRDGILDPGEPRIATTTTDSNGAYSFAGLAVTDGVNGDARYIVDVSDRAGVLAGYWHSLGNQSVGSDNNSKNDPYAVTLSPTNLGTRNITTVDFGYYTLPAAVGNYVWYDTDGDGIQDAGEVGVDGVTVTLTIRYRGNDNALNTADDTVTVLTTVTGDDPNTAGTQTGYYSFRNLLQDEDYYSVGAVEPTFTLTVTGPNGYLTSPVNAAGSTAFNDSNNAAGTTAAPLKGNSSTLSTDTTTTPPSYDFGYFRLTVSGKVWSDTGGGGGVSNDGLMNGIEAGIGSVTVELYKGGVLVATTTTNASGDYSFTQQTTGPGSGQPLQPGSDYQVRIPAGQPALAGRYSSADVGTTTNPTNTGNGILLDDNGLGGGSTSANTFSTTNFTLNGGSVANTAGSVATNSTGTTSQPTIYFGFTTTPTAAEIGEVTAQVNEKHKVIVTWDTMTEVNLVGFMVQRSETKKGGYAPLTEEMIPAITPGQLGGNAYTFSDKKVEGGKTYFYRIKRWRIDGSTALTKPLKVKIPAQENACSGAPQATTPLTPGNAETIKKAKTEFTWNAVPCATRYKWQLRLDSSEGKLVTAKKDLTEPSTTFKKLKPGKTYAWRVMSCNAADECTASEWFSVQIKAKKESKKQKATP